MQESKEEPGSPAQASPKRRKRSKGADAAGSGSARHLRIAALELLQVLPSAALSALHRESASHHQQMCDTVFPLQQEASWIFLTPPAFTQ